MLGAAGLSGGFYGQVGVTAVPLGVLVGVAVGAGAAFLGFRVPAFLLAILMSSAVLVAATQYWKLPEDRRSGSVIDAEVVGCALPGTFVPDALARWERSNTEQSLSLRPGWRGDAPRMLENDPGVVLALLVHRQREVYEQRKPWNSGQLKATRWESSEAVEKFFARFAGPSCDAYPVGARRFFSPEWEGSRVSPPDILPTLLGMSVLADVPPKFQPFAGP